MSLTTFSIFYYGHKITDENYLIDVDEGGGTFQVEIPVGSYTLTTFADILESALNDFGTLTYTVSVNRTSREITIAASAAFDLLVSSGPSIGTSAWSLIGFSGSDRTGASTYTGNLPSGSEYTPQFILQDHVPSSNRKRSVMSTVNESASGELEIVRFGSVRGVQFNIKMITDLPMDDKIILNNPNGVADANDFMDYVTDGNKIEFMPDRSDRSTFETLIIEKTPQSKDGIEYDLKEHYDKGLPNIFETGILQFRVTS